MIKKTRVNLGQTEKPETWVIKPRLPHKRKMKKTTKLNFFNNKILKDEIKNISKYNYKKIKKIW
jgi:hypothetical protein